MTTTAGVHGGVILDLKGRWGTQIAKYAPNLSKNLSVAFWSPPRLAAALAETLLVLLIFRVLFGLTRYALAAPPGFDGGLNLNTAFSFIEGHGYGLFYERFYPFPIETNGPFIFLAGLAMKVGGITPFSTQFANLCFLFAFSTTVYKSLRVVLSRIGALAVVLLAIQTPGRLGMDGLGEVPALTFFFAALVILTSAVKGERPSGVMMFCGGILLGLSFLTKVVALIWIAPTVVFVAVVISGRPRWFYSFAWLLAGLGLPILCWELFRLVELGSLANFRDWWKVEYSLILTEAGVREQASPLSKLATHFDILARETGLSDAQLAVFLVLPYPVIACLIVSLVKRRDFAAILVVSCVASTAAIYLIWWLAVTPTPVAYLRRIINGLILQQCLIGIAFVTLVGWTALLWQYRFGYSGNWKHFRARLAANLAACVLLVWPEIGLLREGDMPRVIKGPQPLDSSADLFRMVNIVRDLPMDARIFGTRWWQAPVIALLSGRKFWNYEWWAVSDISSQPHKYLVFDADARERDPAPFEEILGASTYRTIIDSSAGAIYELQETRAYPPFGASDRTVADLQTGYDFGRSDYRYVRGMHEREVHKWVKTFRWSRPDSAMLLRRKDENWLTLSILIPPEVETIRGNVLMLHVVSPGCIDSEIAVRRGWDQDIGLPLGCPAFERPLPLEVQMHLNGRMPFSESMRGDLRPLSFRIHSAALKHGNYSP